MKGVKPRSCKCSSNNIVAGSLCNKTFLKIKNITRSCIFFLLSVPHMVRDSVKNFLIATDLRF